MIRNRDVATAGRSVEEFTEGRTWPVLGAECEVQL
jgi:hypothetical protein